MTSCRHSNHRNRLPETRDSITRRADICGFRVYITVGFYGHPDPCAPGELFIKLAKHGTELAGVLDSTAITISLALQYGVPWSVLRSHLVHTRFGTPDATYTSLCDGIARVVTDIINTRTSLIGETSDATANSSDSP